MIYSAGVVDIPSKIVAGLWRNQLVWFALAMLVLASMLAGIAWSAIMAILSPWSPGR